MPTPQAALTKTCLRPGLGPGHRCQGAEAFWLSASWEPWPRLLAWVARQVSLWAKSQGDQTLPFRVPPALQHFLASVATAPAPVLAPPPLCALNGAVPGTLPSISAPLLDQESNRRAWRGPQILALPTPRGAHFLPTPLVPAWAPQL